MAGVLAVLIVVVVSEGPLVRVHCHLHSTWWTLYYTGCHCGHGLDFCKRVGSVTGEVGGHSQSFEVETIFLL